MYIFKLNSVLIRTKVNRGTRLWFKQQMAEVVQKWSVAAAHSLNGTKVVGSIPAQVYYVEDCLHPGDAD